MSGGFSSCIVVSGVYSWSCSFKLKFVKNSIRIREPFRNPAFGIWLWIWEALPPNRCIQALPLLFLAPDYANSKIAESKVTNATLDYFKATRRGRALTQSACVDIPLCEVTSDDECICETTVVEVKVFSVTPSRDNILISLIIGCFQAETFDSGIHTPNGCKRAVLFFICWRAAATATPLGPGGNLLCERRQQYWMIPQRNMTVKIIGLSFTFRNPVHFMPLVVVNPEMREAFYKTYTVLDHQFHHPNHPLFLAAPTIQRFGTHSLNLL